MPKKDPLNPYRAFSMDGQAKSKTSIKYQNPWDINGRRAHDSPTKLQNTNYTAPLHEDVIEEELIGTCGTSVTNHMQKYLTSQGGAISYKHDESIDQT